MFLFVIVLFLCIDVLLSKPQSDFRKKTKKTLYQAMGMSLIQSFCY